MTRGFQKKCPRLLVKIFYSAVGANSKEELHGEVYRLILAQQFVIYFVTIEYTHSISIELFVCIRFDHQYLQF